jgi:hypothetical protein
MTDMHFIIVSLMVGHFPGTDNLPKNYKKLLIHKK